VYNIPLLGTGDKPLLCRINARRTFSFTHYCFRKYNILLKRFIIKWQKFLDDTHYRNGFEFEELTIL
jgi:hypothetical protein